MHKFAKKKKTAKQSATRRTVHHFYKQTKRPKTAKQRQRQATSPAQPNLKATVGKSS
jgi:hypothetical protein